MSLKLLPCPFCGKTPIVVPINPEIEGNAWGEVKCVNKHCFAQPTVRDGCKVTDDAIDYKKAAIKRWNRRK